MEDLTGVVIGTFWEMHQGRDMDKWLETMEGPDGPLGKAGGQSLVVKGGPAEFKRHWGKSEYLIG
jgi:hypothetical protein